MTNGKNNSIIVIDKEEGRTKKMENKFLGLTIEKWLELYEKFNGCNCYEIYFLYRHDLYKIELKTLGIEMLKMGKESSKKGGHLKLRLAVTSAIKQAWIASGKAKKLMSEEKFVEVAQDLGINKGQVCEYLSAKARKQEYTLDSTRFDKAGDVNLKRKKIQVKFENASLTQLRTIAKVAKLAIA